MQSAGNGIPCETSAHEGNALDGGGESTRLMVCCRSEGMAECVMSSWQSLHVSEEDEIALFAKAESDYGTCCTLRNSRMRTAK